MFHLCDKSQCSAPAAGELLSSVAGSSTGLPCTACHMRAALAGALLLQAVLFWEKSGQQSGEKWGVGGGQMFRCFLQG